MNFSSKAVAKTVSWNFFLVFVILFCPIKSNIAQESSDVPTIFSVPKGIDSIVPSDAPSLVSPPNALGARRFC